MDTDKFIHSSHSIVHLYIHTVCISVYHEILRHMCHEIRWQVSSHKSYGMIRNLSLESAAMMHMICSIQYFAYYKWHGLYERLHSTYDMQKWIDFGLKWNLLTVLSLLNYSKHCFKTKVIIEHHLVVKSLLVSTESARTVHSAWIDCCNQTARDWRIFPIVCGHYESSFPTDLRKCSFS